MKATEPKALLSEIESAIRAKDQVQVSAVVHKYGELGHGSEYQDLADKVYVGSSEKSESGWPQSPGPRRTSRRRSSLSWRATCASCAA